MSILRDKLANIGFDLSWSYTDVALSMVKLSLMLVRGLPYYFLFRKTKGLIFLGKGVKIRNPYRIETEGTIIIEDYAEIQGLSKKGIILGKKVTIGKFSMIRPSGYYGREIGEGLKIGSHSNIGAYNYIGCSGYIEIADNVMISPRVSIYSENHNFTSTLTPMKSQGVTRKSVKIQDDCWLAANSVILSGVTIGKGSVVAAGSVVAKDVPAYSIAAGVPAKIIKSRVEYNEAPQ